MMLRRSFTEVFVFLVVGVIGSSIGLVGTTCFLAKHDFLAAYSGNIDLVLLLVHLGGKRGTVCLLYYLADSR